MRWIGTIAVCAACAVSASADPAKSSANSRKSSSASSKSVTLAKGNTHTGKRRTRNARSHIPPPPTYQLHPDPERYQQIQQALADRGYFKGQVNGEWNDDSVDALKRFQTDQKLPDDGKINALSLIGLGLGPKHDGSTAATVPAPNANLQTPPDPPHVSEIQKQ